MANLSTGHIYYYFIFRPPAWIDGLIFRGLFSNIEPMQSRHSFFLFLANKNDLYGSASYVKSYKGFLSMRNSFSEVFPVVASVNSSEIISILRNAHLSLQEPLFLYFERRGQDPKVYSLDSNSIFSNTLSPLEWALDSVFPPRSSPIYVNSLNARIIFSENLMKLHSEKALLSVIDNNSTSFFLKVSSHLAELARSSASNPMFSSFRFLIIDYFTFQRYIDRVFGRSNSPFPRFLLLDMKDESSQVRGCSRYYDLEEIQDDISLLTLPYLENALRSIDSSHLEVPDLYIYPEDIATNDDILTMLMCIYVYVQGAEAKNIHMSDVDYPPVSAVLGAYKDPSNAAKASEYPESMLSKVGWVINRPYIGSAVLVSFVFFVYSTVQIIKSLRTHSLLAKDGQV